MKSHFIREKYDYARYGNKLSKLTVQGFYKRRDRMFFERMSRQYNDCLLYTSPSPRDRTRSRMPSSA